MHLKPLDPDMYLNPESFWFTGVIQQLQLKLREHCCQASAAQNFRPAPGTVCCAQFSGKTHVHIENILPSLQYETVWLMRLCQIDYAIY